LEDADDVVQNMFVRIFERPNSIPLSSQHNAVGYLVKIAFNMAIDAHRREQRRLRALARLVDDELGEPQRPELVLDVGAGELDLHQSLDLISAYVARLPHELAVAYELLFRQGLSERDAAVQLGATRRRVRTLKRRLVTGGVEALRLGARPLAGGADGVEEGSMPGASAHESEGP
jgi:RNA polymerase sigma factor (sigma-70 family)